MPKLIKTKVEMEGRTFEEYALVDADELPPWTDEEELGIVGFPTPRVDGAERVSGTAQYTHDVRLPGMAYTAALTSPHPHARLVSVDVSEARALPGVLGVLTRTEAHEQLQGGVRRMFTDQLRYAGEIVAAVAATDPDIARDAVALIKSEYEQLPHVVDIEVAAQPDAPKVHTNGNIFGGKPQIVERGDIDTGFAEADVTIEHTYRTATQLHSCLEPHGSVAHWEGDSLTIYESTQHVFGVRNAMARWLGLSQNKVRAICQYIGGGFGSKAGPGVNSVFAALLAKQIGRPVQFMLDRTTEQIGGGNRSAMVMMVRLGAKNDGTLTAMDLHCLADVGAYGPWLPFFAGPALMSYRCPHARSETLGLYTNTGSFMAFRAPGFVEGTFAIESALDELATALKLDPLALRRQNIPDHDQTNGSAFSNYPIEACFQQGAERIEWHARTNGQTSSHDRMRRGIGMSNQIWWGGGGPPAYATVEVNTDGSATLRTGTQDIGTGTKTVLTQVCAEELGLPLAAITTVLGDSGSGQYAPISGGSMTVPSMAPAVRSAARDARIRLLDIVSQMLERPVEALEIRDGQIYEGAENHGRLKDLIGKLGDVMIIGNGSRGPNPDGVTIITSGAQFVEVAVDTLTGHIQVLRVIAAHDCGRIINPLTYRSQIEGGIIQAIGYALTEQRVMDANSGIQLNANLGDYKLPTLADIPEIEVLRIDIPDLVANPTGAKGAGEPPIIPTPAAIANAVYDAIGIRIRELPMTPDKVLAALQRQ
ncbi:MAG: xanthine dehydrogenase family protein molybdopterin-binding subunit [Chloroflexi bacterium AL-W]|nr:xanthine dehydrogenase family protein molybdopterin-binding subunit [Chloroflexi bacterium AL-N1]NOK70778.1 xanthine dehydrogenase family protein molybdopterin-binding subunit [Chloroflexi bacterium AL-N10]NOK78338.1 xanthine dehydrogenase family protein molybdopterin-binding subunit [Chloroflexi bacterium AL-N5]NOK85681.1 xanthine dehydrogenase family protein molybdopterin-binding subunit [Chloroflexi bacterium AL-W]NOK92595.1 xanthine dehydrogenase family protein molybdopterin-binding subu